MYVSTFIQIKLVCMICLALELLSDLVQCTSDSVWESYEGMLPLIVHLVPGPFLYASIPLLCLATIVNQEVLLFYSFFHDVLALEPA